ncbi:hypothetical protein CX676_05880 [Paracoccus zhejiangensis]|uniref:Uncharacterized protein n=1 Tax=Paracoccus zhejiangensis TaxID=1077935 RepID=A0A2H5EWU8_9RHOB|nr:hypothetical protein CX676_05880 [Paracoccus zhejiangensis]
MLKNRILLENHDLPGALEVTIGAFADHDNHHRCRVSIGNPMPADASFGRANAIVSESSTIKEQTMKRRRLSNQRDAAKLQTG